jgi:hypothetical protein
MVSRVKKPLNWRRVCSLKWIISRRFLFRNTNFMFPAFRGNLSLRIILVPSQRDLDFVIKRLSFSLKKAARCSHEISCTEDPDMDGGATPSTITSPTSPSAWQETV